MELGARSDHAQPLHSEAVSVPLVLYYTPTSMSKVQPTNRAVVIIAETTQIQMRETLARDSGSLETQCLSQTSSGHVPKTCLGKFARQSLQ